MKKLKSIFYLSNSYCYLLLFFYFQLQYPQHQKKRNKFDHKPSGNIYYYDENGHTVKGLVTIRGKKYYFNEKGIQQNGWQKIKGDIISSKSATAVMLHGNFPACKWYLSYQKWRSTL